MSRQRTALDRRDPIRHTADDVPAVQGQVQRVTSRWIRPLTMLGWEWTSGAKRWSTGALVAMAFAAFNGVGVVRSDLSAVRITVALLLLLALMAVYVVIPGGLERAGMSVRWSVIAIMVLLTVPQFLLVGPDGTVLLIFVTVTGGFLLPLRPALALGLGSAATMVVLTWRTADGPQWELALTAVALTLWMGGFAKNIRLNRVLMQARADLARTAVLAERDRIARDLHDILGHSLTAITVKAALARQLVDRAPDKVQAEISDIERLARSALADVRSTTSGIRERSLAGELAVAQAVLTAAGITAVMPGAVDDVLPAGRELFGYVVKEAVTNVVRHSGATHCRVRLGADWVEIVDDGRGIPAESGSTDGNGLPGLRERMAAAGGALSTRSLLPSGFSVRAELTSTGATR